MIMDLLLNTVWPAVKILLTILVVVVPVILGVAYMTLAERKVIALLELHTFSSLNPDFIPTYAGALDAADEAWVCYSPNVLAHKRLPPLDAEKVRAAFDNPGIHVVTDPRELEETVQQEAGPNTVFLLMSSGRFEGVDLVGAIEKALA